MDTPEAEEKPKGPIQVLESLAVDFAKRQYVVGVYEYGMVAAAILQAIYWLRLGAELEKDAVLRRAQQAKNN